MYSDRSLSLSKDEHKKKGISGIWLFEILDAYLSLRFYQHFHILFYKDNVNPTQ